MGIVLLNSCTKVDKIGPNSFTNKTEWQITELSIGGNEIEALPKWEISKNDASIWCHSDGSKVSFYWVFSQNNNYFEFYLNQDDPDNKISAAYKQCDNLSGKYLVVTSKKDVFEFETNETNGYIGPKTYIRIE